MIKILVEKVEEAKKNHQYQLNASCVATVKSEPSVNHLYVCQHCKISFNSSLFETQDVFMQKFHRHVNSCSSNITETCLIYFYKKCLFINFNFLIFPNNILFFPKVLDKSIFFSKLKLKMKYCTEDDNKKKFL